MTTQVSLPDADLLAVAFHIAESGPPPDLGSLATALGRAPAGLRTYGSVGGLMAAVFARCLEPPAAELAALIDDDGLPALAALEAFRERHRAAGDSALIALFLHAVIERAGHAPPHTPRLITPLLRALRAEAGLPERVAAYPGESEVVIGFLADFALLVVRASSLTLPGPSDPFAVGTLYLRLLLSGAVAAISALQPRGTRGARQPTLV